MGKPNETLAAMPYPSLKKIGVTTIAETLHILPQSYNDYRKPCSRFSEAIERIKQKGLFDAPPKTLFTLKIKLIGYYTSSKVKTERLKDAFRVSFILTDADGLEIGYTIFGNVWPTKDMRAGDDIAIYGEVGSFNGKPCIQNGQTIHKSDIGKILPVYKGVSGLVAGKTMGLAVHDALAEIAESGQSLMNRAFTNEHLFARLTKTFPDALLKSIHLPKTVEEGEHACTLARKLSAFTLLQKGRQAAIREVSPKASIHLERDVINRLVARLPFSLTKDQFFAILEIVDDLKTQTPSRILLSADVGTGKSVVFMIPIVAAYLAACKVGILAPTTLLAEQLCNEINSYFPECGAFIVDDKTDLSKQKGVAIGTTALAFAKKRCNHAFDLVVGDEQQKFGVQQKEDLLSSHTNLIESSATPIPRSMAMVLFSSYRIVKISECPVKKDIKCKIVNTADRPKLIEFLDKIIKNNGQIALVYPDVNSEENEDGTPAEGASKENVKDAEIRWKTRYPGRVAMLYGAMPENEKKQVIEDFKARKYDVLISSTVIEVGITLPDLKAIAIINADHFGLAGLHQLRGRVARKGGVGYCFVLPPKAASDKSMKRLNTFVQTLDGYELAEMDMDERGFGEFEAEQGKQKGKSAMLFFNAKIYKKDIEDAAKWGVEA